MVPDVPMAVAVALILNPIEAGLVGFLSAFDSKEIQGQITPTKALFNRCQTGLTYFAGSYLVHAVSASATAPRHIVLMAFLALAAITLGNYFLIGLGISLEHRYSFGDVISRLRFGTPVDFILTFMAWGLLAAMLAALYNDVNLWVLFAFLGPTLLGRQVLMRSQMLVEALRAYQSREAAMAQLEVTMDEERSDERHLIAADLHDEVLQPLFKVTLLAQVLKADLVSGRLLDMDQDVPELVAACELASDSIRQLIGDLRRSQLGPGGLRAALQSMVRALQRQTSIQVEVSLAEVETDPISQLVLYQVAKEAVGNAVQHSKATTLRLDLDLCSDGIQLSVKDDGIGFDPLIQASGHHFGLEIMRERASAIGGALYIDSGPGLGCKVTLLLRESNT
jgi:signal transduction histidine kinase